MSGEDSHRCYFYLSLKLEKLFEEWFGKSGISILFFRMVGIAERGVTGWGREGKKRCSVN